MAAAPPNPPAPNASSNNSSNSLFSSNNDTTSSSNNKFNKALNSEIASESAGNKSAGNSSAANSSAENKSNLASGLNSRLKKSQNLYAANSSEGGPKKPSVFESLLNLTKPSKTSEVGTPPGEETGLTGDISVAVNSENYIVILGVFIVLVLVLLIYFLSKTFNVSRTLDKMSMYKRYQKITNVDMTKTEASQPLSTFHISSSYNSCHNGNQILSYTSELVLRTIIRSGARYLEFNVFSSAYGPSGIPVVSNGYKRGEWKLMLNTLTFESVIRTISENAFKVSSEDEGAPNNNDPIFIGLNLSTGNNLDCLNLMADILIDYFRDRLLDAKYAYQFTTDFAKTPLRELENKVVIFASSGFEGSRLEELINAVWVDYSFANEVKEGFAANPPASNKKNNTKNNNVEGKIKKALTGESAVAQGAKKSAVGNNKRSGGPSDTQIDAEKKRLTQVSSLAEELKNSGVDIPDVDELDEKAQQAAADEIEAGSTKSKASDQTNQNETMLDVPNPTGLGLDIARLGENQRATIMRISAARFKEPGFDGAVIKAHTTTGLAIVVPHEEGDFLTRNYDPQKPFELGCQFVAMNYQLIDENMDKYITKFENHGILPV